MSEESKPHSGLAEARLALDMLKRGQYLNADHPLVVLEDALDGLEEQLEDWENRARMERERCEGFVEQLETLRELNERVIRERDEGHAENERLNEQLEAAHERLSQYEQPGYITAVQKVIELKEQFDACDAERKRLQDQVDALDAMLGRHHEIGTLSDRVLSQNCPVCYPAMSPADVPHAYVRVPGTGMNFCGVRGCKRTIAEHDGWMESYQDTSPAKEPS